MRLIPLVVVFAFLFGCSGGQSVAPSAPATGAPTSSVNIQHVVVIVQENRSFDNVFEGFPGADTATSGRMHDGTVVPLTTTSFEENAGGGVADLDHSHPGMLTAYDGGKMDAFDLEQAGAFSGTGQIAAGRLPYAVLPRSETTPYWTLASKYTLGDRMFESDLAPSFSAHQYLIAGQAGGTVDVPSAMPWGCDSPVGTTTPILVNGVETTGPFPCFSYKTIADELDAQGISWRYYAPEVVVGGGDLGQIWSAFDAIKQIRYGADWSSKVVSPETQALTDFASGNIPAVTWVIPSYANSDHSGNSSAQGPQWVANLVNAIGQSPVWNSTAIFIVWDDPGGWYDHVPPQQLDAYGLGFRVPLIVVSPYAKHAYVSHVQHEFGSILHFIEERFALAPLTNADSRADDLTDCFDFSQKPSSYVPLAVRMNAKAIMERTPAISQEPPDND